MTFCCRLILWITAIRIGGGLMADCVISAGEIHDAVRINDLASVKAPWRKTQN